MKKYQKLSEKLENLQVHAQKHKNQPDINMYSYLQHCNHKLKDAEYIFHTLQHHEQIGLWKHDLNTKETLWTWGLYDLLGYHYKEIQPDFFTILDFVCFDNKNETLDHIYNTLANSSYCAADIHLNTSRGEKIPVSFYTEVLCNGENTPCSIIGSVMLNSELNNTSKQSRTISKCDEHLNNIPVGIAEISDKGTFRYINNNMARSFGYNKEELLNTAFKDLIPDDKKLHPLRKGLEAIKYKRPIVYRNARNGNRYINLIVPQKIQNKPGAQIISIDHTKEWEQAEQMLESESKYKELVEEANDIIYTQDHQGNLTYVSPNIIHKLGYEPSEVIDKSISEIIFSEDHPKLRNTLQQIQKGQSTISAIDYRLIQKNGQLRWFTSNVVAKYDNGKLLKLKGIARDIQQQKEAEIQLQKREKALAAYINEAPYGIFVLDKNGICLSANKEAELMTGLKTTILKDKSFLDYIYSEDRAPANETFTAMKKEGKKEGTYRVAIDNEEIRYFSLKFTKVSDDEFLMFAHDITNEKLQADQLAKQNKELKSLNAMKDKFFSIIAHDLKNPFTNLLGFVQLLAQTHHNASDEKRQKYINILYDSGWQIYNLLENLLTWSRLNRNKMRQEVVQVPVIHLVNETIDLMKNSAAEKNIKLSTPENKKIAVKTDINMAQTVLRNLISNAIKFTPDEGHVQIDYEQTNDAKVLIAVHDTGIGIPVAEQEKLFRIDEHYTRQGTSEENGTGLGLILSKEFVEKNNGEIWVESEEGKGTTFYFTLPAGKV